MIDQSDRTTSITEHIAAASGHWDEAARLFSRTRASAVKCSDLNIFISLAEENAGKTDWTSLSSLPLAAQHVGDDETATGTKRSAQEM